MKIEKIKPIPKYIEKKIKAIDTTYPVRGKVKSPRSFNNKKFGNDENSFFLLIIILHCFSISVDESHLFELSRLTKSI